MRQIVLVVVIGLVGCGEGDGEPTGEAGSALVGACKQLMQALCDGVIRCGVHFDGRAFTQADCDAVLDKFEEDGHCNGVWSGVADLSPAEITACTSALDEVGCADVCANADAPAACAAIEDPSPEPSSSVMTCQ